MGLLNWGAIDTTAQNIVKEFDIRASNVQTPVRTLSGGNQQKVVLGRELSVELQLLVAFQPTRGVDVASIEFIHRKILEASNAGTAVLLISSDLDELMSLSDRIAVLLRGQIVGFVETEGLTKEVLGKLMLGVDDEDQHA